MKEQDLIELGFKKQTDNDGVSEYYYYTLHIGTEKYDSQNLCLITNANDETKDGDWFACIFEFSEIVFKNLKDLRSLITLLKNNLK